MCGAWSLQSNYGGRWPGTSTWWEYHCTYETAQYYPHPCPEVGACDAVCYGYPFDCYSVSQVWTDYFYWDGSNAVFDGEFYSSSIDDGNGYSASSAAWWDAPTARWYNLGPYSLTVSTDGTGSGAIGSSPAGISCGYTCQASFDAGTTVTLTPTPDASSTFTGWSGDCSGGGSCQVTMNQARSVTATFALKTSSLTVAKAGTGSGQVTSSPAGISCGNACQASFNFGTVATLTASPDAGSLFTGWSGDCSGSGSCQVTMNQAHSVTATFALSVPPQASFTVTCTGLTCTFDGSGSADPAGSIASFAWDFGDGTTGSGKTASHAYGRAGTYTVTLTVIDNAGASGSISKAVHAITLSARGYKQNGLQKVDLSWSGPSGASLDVYRNGAKVATVSTTAYTDTVPKRPDSYRYRVCAPATSSCSNDVTVSF
jgi:PKD repeat protein